MIGEADFDSLFQTQYIHADASLICLSGDPAAPTIDWCQQWVLDLNRRISRLRVSGSPFPEPLRAIYDLVTAQGQFALVPPIGYRDAAAGEVLTSLPAPRLQSGGSYVVDLIPGSVIGGLLFRVR